MSEWISVDERLPLEHDYKTTYNDIKVLVTDGVIVSVEMFCIGGNHIGKPWRKFSDYGELDEKQITHWMPIPEPPK